MGRLPRVLWCLVLYGWHSWDIDHEVSQEAPSPRVMKVRHVLYAFCLVQLAGMVSVSTLAQVAVLFFLAALVACGVGAPLSDLLVRQNEEICGADNA